MSNKSTRRQASSGSKRTGLTKDDIKAMVAKLIILTPVQRKRNEGHRLLCKVDRCKTQARSEKDDMCKKHFGWFKLVGRETKDAPSKELNQTSFRDSDESLVATTKLAVQTQLSQPKMQSTNIGDNNLQLPAAELPEQLVQLGNTTTKLPFGRDCRSASSKANTHSSNATSKNIATRLDENKAAELEEDLFQLVKQTINLDYQYTRMNELLESAVLDEDEPDLDPTEGSGEPDESNEKIDVVDGTAAASLEGMSASSSKADSGSYKRKKKRGKAEEDSKGGKKRRRKDKDMGTNEEMQDVVLGFVTCNKCDMIFANADAAWNHEDVCPGDTVYEFG